MTIVKAYSYLKLSASATDLQESR